MEPGSFKLFGNKGRSILNTVQRLMSRTTTQTIELCLNCDVLMVVVRKYVQELLEECQRQKSDDTFISIKELGNEAYRKKEWQTALQLYSDSIVHGTGSRLAVGYANRSAVLFETEKYSLCVDDIGRAIGIPECPQNLKFKLYRRKAMSLNKMGYYDEAGEALDLAKRYVGITEMSENKRNTLTQEIMKLKVEISESVENPTVSELATTYDEFQLSYGPSDSVSCLSSGAKVLYNGKGKGRSVVATRALKLGDVISFERPYASYLQDSYTDQYCWNCCAIAIICIPCNHCCQIRYCSEVCRDEGWSRYHSHECGFLSALTTFGCFVVPLRVIQRVGIHKILKLTQVEMEETKSPTGIPGFNEDAHYDSESYYAVYHLSLFKLSHHHLNAQVISGALVLMIFLEQAAMKEILSTSSSEASGDKGNGNGQLTRDQRIFLANIVARHIMQYMSNGSEQAEWVIHKTSCHPFHCEKKTDIGGALYPTYSLFNHSCDPNLVSQGVGEYSLLRTIRDVKEGEELCYSYCTHKYDLPDQRQEDLTLGFNFVCSCKLCIVQSTFSSLGDMLFMKTINGTPSAEVAYALGDASILLSENDYVPAMNIAVDALICHCSATAKSSVTKYTRAFFVAHTVIQHSLKRLICQCAETVSKDSLGECIQHEYSICFTSDRNLARIFEVVERSIGTLLPIETHNGIETFLSFAKLLEYACITLKIFQECPELQNMLKWKKMATKCITFLSGILKTPKNLLCRHKFVTELKDRLQAVIDCKNNGDDRCRDKHVVKENRHAVLDCYKKVNHLQMLHRLRMFRE